MAAVTLLEIAIYIAMGGAALATCVALLMAAFWIVTLPIRLLGSQRLTDRLDDILLWPVETVETVVDWIADNTALQVVGGMTLWAGYCFATDDTGGLLILIPVGGIALFEWGKSVGRKEEQESQHFRQSLGL